MALITQQTIFSAFMNNQNDCTQMITPQVIIINENVEDAFHNQCTNTVKITIANYFSLIDESVPLRIHNLRLSKTTFVRSDNFFFYIWFSSLSNASRIHLKKLKLRLRIESSAWESRVWLTVCIRLWFTLWLRQLVNSSDVHWVCWCMLFSVASSIRRWMGKRDITLFCFVFFFSFKVSIVFRLFYVLFQDYFGWFGLNIECGLRCADWNLFQIQYIWFDLISCRSV